jgi:hypothetical protein
MLVFEDAIVISLRPISVSLATRLPSRPGQLHHRPARPRRDESIRIDHPHERLRRHAAHGPSGPNGVNEVLRKALQGRDRPLGSAADGAPWNSCS